ncbi:MAG: hypothetical protein AAFU57_15240 [Bacteroidota bacterium]
MFEKLKIETAEKTIKEFIQEDYTVLWSKYDKPNVLVEDDGVYFNPMFFPESGPGLHMIKKSVPTKMQSLIEFLNGLGLNYGAIKGFRIEKASNFNTDVIDYYAFVMFDMTVAVELRNGKTITVETIAAHILLLTSKGWRIVNEGISSL